MTDQTCTHRQSLHNADTQKERAGQGKASSQELCIALKRVYPLPLERERENEVPGETPSTACPLIGITSFIIRGETPTSRTGLEPSPSNTGDKLAWPRACVASGRPRPTEPHRDRREYLPLDRRTFLERRRYSSGEAMGQCEVRLGASCTLQTQGMRTR